MADTVKKIFTVLAVVVICIVVAAFAINILVPNALTGVVNAVEDTLYSATGLSIDLNGDGSGGVTITSGEKNVRSTGTAASNTDNSMEKKGKVTGFSGNATSNP